MNKKFEIDLSIIIPHFNAPELLEKLLKTIPKKENIEIIVIDDNSTNGVEKFEYLKVKKEYSHIKFFSNTSGNKGAGACRNIGINKSSGRWLLFSDSDDWFLNGFYEIVSKYFSTSFDVIFFIPTSVILESGEITDRHLHYENLIRNYIHNPGHEEELFLRYRFTSPCSKLINRKFLNEFNINFDEVVASNDVMFSTKIGFFYKKFEVDPNCIYCITRGKGSLTTNISQDVFDCRLKVFIDHYKFLKRGLSKEDFNKLNLHGLDRVILAIRYRFRLRKILSIIIIFKRNNVSLFNKKFLNPIVVMQKVLWNYNRENIEKKYYSN